jgi:predicted DNA-binding protein (MmcQ/YjbR family)
MTRPDVPDDVVGRLRGICLALPEAHEEQAWVGTRWRIRTKTFAHVLGISDEYPPAYTRDAPLVGDATVLTFRSDGQELHALVSAGLPFYKPRWNPQVVAMIVGPAVDWEEVRELLTESYCLLAPKRLAARVPRPGSVGGEPG